MLKALPRNILAFFSTIASGILDRSTCTSCKGAIKSTRGKFPSALNGVRQEEASPCLWYPDSSLSPPERPPVPRSFEPARDSSRQASCHNPSQDKPGRRQHKAQSTRRERYFHMAIEPICSRLSFPIPLAALGPHSETIFEGRRNTFPDASVEVRNCC